MSFPTPMGAFNYFNYFTEVEEYFWRKRGTHILVSPLDWAIVETWQKAGIPIAAVLKGIDRAFESWQRSRRGAAGRQLKSLAYCVDAVLDAAEENKEAAAGSGPQTGSVPQGETFSREALRAHFARNVERLARAADKLRATQPELANIIQRAGAKVDEMAVLLDSPAQLDLEDLERRLTVLEDKLAAALTARASEDVLLAIRRAMDRQLAPYRRKMTAEQLSQLERSYMRKRLFEESDIPRLSLFYLT